MVRFKNRYLVVDIQTPGQQLRASHSEAELLQELRAAVKDTLGEFELAKLVASLKVVHFSPQTRTAVLRVQRDSARGLVAAMFFVNSVLGSEARLKVLRLSGTIRKCEQFLRDRLLAGEAG